MTVLELKEALEEVPDDTIVLRLSAAGFSPVDQAFVSQCLSMGYWPPANRHYYEEEEGGPIDAFFIN